MLFHVLFSMNLLVYSIINILKQFLPSQFHDMHFLHIYLRKKEIQQTKLPLPYSSHLHLAEIYGEVVVMFVVLCQVTKNFFLWYGCIKHQKVDAHLVWQSRTSTLSYMECLVLCMFL